MVVLAEWTFDAGPDEVKDFMDTHVRAVPNSVASGLVAHRLVAGAHLRQDVDTDQVPFAWGDFSGISNRQHIALAPNSNGVGDDTTIDFTTYEGYVDIRLQGEPGVSFAPHTLDFSWARGGGATPRGFGVRSSHDNYATWLDAPVTNVPTQRPDLTAYSIDLTAIGRTADVTLRLFFWTPFTSSDLESYGNPGWQINGEVFQPSSSGALWADPIVEWESADRTWNGVSIKKLTPLPRTDEDLLVGPRITSFRFDVLDHDENLIGTLDSVETSGSLTWDSDAAIKGNGVISVQDLPNDPDIRWDQVRIKPWAVVEGVAGGSKRIETPLGVFLCSTPVEQWTEVGLRWDVELLDKNSILDQDIPEDPDTGYPWHYSALVNSNLVDHVVTIIGETGEYTPAIEPSDVLVPNYMFWDIGTTRLRIVNDLLQAGGFMPLWTDGNGQFQVTPYVSPTDRPTVYDLVAPLGDGPTSVQSPVWQRELDWYAIPNRYVAYAPGDEQVPPGQPGTGEVGIATNEDPDDPLGFPQRGRWVTVTETDVDADDLDLYARRQLDRMRAVGATYTVEHAYLPNLRPNSTVRYVNAEAGLSVLCVVMATDVKFDPTALCTSTLMEIGPVTATAELGRAARARRAG